MEQYRRRLAAETPQLVRKLFPLPEVFRLQSQAALIGWLFLCKVAAVAAVADARHRHISEEVEEEENMWLHYLA